MASLFELDPGIDTGTIQQAKSTLEGLKGTVQAFIMHNEDSTVDVDNHGACKCDAGLWNIDMDSEKDTVVKDLEICIQRIQNIIDAVECVKTNHTALQNTLQAGCNKILSGYGFNTVSSGCDSCSSCGDGSCGDGGYYGDNFGSGFGGSADGSCGDGSCGDGSCGDGSGFGSEFGSGSGTGFGSGTGNISENAGSRDEVYEALSDLGLNLAAVCGIMANMYRESKFDPTAYNPNDNGGPSYGLCQWHNERYVNLQNWCSSNGLDYQSIDGQVKFLKHELQGTYSSVYSQLKSVSNTAEGAVQAAQIFLNQFEVGYSNGIENTMAQEYFEYYSNRGSEEDNVNSILGELV